MIQYAVRGHDLSDVTSPESLAEKISEVGINSVQLALPFSFPLMASNAENLNPGMGAHIRKVLGEKNIDVAILSCYINMIHPDEEIRETLLKKFEAYVQHAKYFGAAMVVSETGSVLPEIVYTEENFTEEAFEILIPVIQRLVQAGEQFGVLVGIEPGLNHPLHSLEKVEELIKRVDSPYLGIVLDPTNLITKDDYLSQVGLVRKAFERFGDKIVAVHLKDFVVDGDKIVPTNMGQGLIDHQSILKIIKDYKPYSYVVLEETKDNFIREALKLL